MRTVCVRACVQAVYSYRFIETVKLPRVQLLDSLPPVGVPVLVVEVVGVWVVVVVVVVMVMVKVATIGMEAVQVVLWDRDMVGERVGVRLTG